MEALEPWRSGRKSGKRRSGRSGKIRSPEVLGIDPSSLEQAAKTIRNGGLVVYPTDTVYGLACDPFNVEAVKRVFEAKGRGPQPLPVLAASLEDAKRVAYFDERALKIAERLWPGAITLVLKRRPELPSVVTCGRDTVGVRVPADPVALELARLSGGLIVGTSANLSGRPAPRTVGEALEQLGQRIDLAIDGGPCQLGLPSTVLDLTGERPVILREGPVGRKAIAEALGVRETEIVSV